MQLSVIGCCYIQTATHAKLDTVHVLLACVGGQYWRYKYRRYYRRLFFSPEALLALLILVNTPSGTVGPLRAFFSSCGNRYFWVKIIFLSIISRNFRARS